MTEFKSNLITNIGTEALLTFAKYLHILILVMGANKSWVHFQGFKKRVDPIALHSDKRACTVLNFSKPIHIDRIDIHSVHNTHSVLKIK